MTTDIFPAGINSQGNNTWIITPTSPLNADKTGVLITTLSGATAVDLTCYLPAEEQEITFEQDRLTDTRACDESVREDFGTAKFTRESIFHIAHPQGDATDPGNLAVGALPPMSRVFGSVRMGVDHDDPLAVDEKWDVYEITTGDEHITPRESGKYRREVKTSFTRVAHGVPAVAGP